MKERAELFGDQGSIYGIVSEPDISSPARRPALVLLNAGLMHHIGPFRLYVLMARALSKLGFTVLRFDLSGKGDSPTRAKNMSYRDSVRADVTDALDFLESSRGIHEFVLLGLCSGADDAFDSARRDSRVTGVALLDGYAYRTAGFYLRHYLPRLLRPSKWAGFLLRLVKRSVMRSSDSGLDDDVFGMAFPPKEEFENGLQDLLERKAAVLIVHSAGWFEYYNYADQFRDAFPKTAAHPAIRTHYFEKADHTYTIGSDRKALVELVCDWADTSF
jgi:pimeloyl-ACP methyl ester carboxylesterase